MKILPISALCAVLATPSTAAVIDMFDLNMNGNAGFTGVMSNVSLDLGVEYLVTISGTFEIGCDGTNNCLTDAEYYVPSIGAGAGQPFDNSGLSNTTGVGTDISALLDDMNVDWGPFDPSRSYTTTFIGTGGLLKVSYQDTNYGDNSGSLQVKIETKDMNGVIPLPAGLPLGLTTLAALGLMRRRRKV